MNHWKNSDVVAQQEHAKEINHHHLVNYGLHHLTNNVRK